MKKTILLSITFVIFNCIGLTAQSLNPTYSIGSSGTANSFKGGYTFAYADSGTPWNGPLISYGGFNNQYDCQINSDYGPQGGSHISYRTKNGDTNTWNAWNELAIRGSNNFIGNQSIAGNLGIGNSNPQATLDIVRAFNAQNTTAIKIMYQGSWSAGIYATNYRFIDIQSTEEGNILAVNAYGMGIGFNPPSYNSPDKLYINGNVGIGTTKTTAKLTVAGNINSREVKVTVDAGADFVFEDNYDLPSLDSVDQYIKENKHLPEIASAEEMKKDGINLSEMNIKLLQKIEELTLYTIEQQKNTEKLTKVIEALTERLEVVERK